jgi:hypothetical protein
LRIIRLRDIREGEGADLNNDSLLSLFARGDAAFALACSREGDIECVIPRPDAAIGILDNHCELEDAPRCGFAAQEAVLIQAQSGR